MFKNPSDDDSILQTIQLTSQLENNLRKIISNRKNNALKTQYNQKELDRSQYESLQNEVKKLKADNKELMTDNEQVCRDLLHLKQQNRQLKRELAEHKKYIAYLQSYTQDLKKQLVFWMRKPLNSQEQGQENNFGNLMTEVLKLRRENETKQLQFHDLKKTAQAAKQTKSIPSSSRAYLKKKMSILDDSRSSYNQPAKTTPLKPTKKNSANISNQCTSCNYQLYASSKRKRLPSSASVSSKKKDRLIKHLCQCHRRYVQTSQFLP